MADSKEQRQRQERREREAISRARRTGKPETYIDEDGCEVTVTPGGHAFYNASDWW